MLVVRICPRHRIADSTNDLATRQISLDSFYGRCKIEICRANLPPRHIGWTFSKVPRIPFRPFRVIRLEVVNLLYAGQADTTLQGFVKPRRAGPSGSDSDKIRQSENFLAASQALPLSMQLANFNNRP